MNGRPVGEEKIFIAVSRIGFEIPTAKLADVNSQSVLSFSGEDCELAIVIVLAERTTRSAVAPARPAESAGQQSAAPRIGASKLSHTRR